MADAAAPWKELSKWIEMDGAIGLFGWTFDVLFLSSRPSILRISSQLLITQAYAGNSLATQNLSPLRPTECSLFCVHCRVEAPKTKRVEYLKEFQNESINAYFRDSGHRICLYLCIRESGFRSKRISG